MTEKRFMLDDCGELIDLNNHKFVDYGEECCNLLNEFNDEKKELKSLCNVLIAHIEKNSIAFVIDEDIRRLLE